MEAVEALDSREARIPWEDPVTKKGGLRRIVTATDIPRGPGALDDVVTLTVHLPPGATAGPVMPASLPFWGTRSAPAYRAQIGLAFRWHDPGRTRFPVKKPGRGQHWIQSADPEDYEPFTDAELAALCYLTSTNQTRRQLVQRAKAILKKLEENGDVRLVIDERGTFRVLPPSNPSKS